ncbi:MAG: alpha/beta hydrolase, partial [Mesorhizobium sp.]
EQCHVVPGAGHAPFWERPDLFNPMLSRFAEAVATHDADTALPALRRTG